MNSMKFAWAGVFVLAIVVLGVRHFGPSADEDLMAKGETAEAETRAPTQPEPREVERPRPTDRCAGMDHETITDGLMGSLIQRVEGEWRNIYVTRQWYAMPLNEKQNVSQYIAECQSAGRWTKVYDAYSGKTLAKYSSSMGYSNYE